jgi:hypothetical protein
MRGRAAAMRGRAAAMRPAGSTTGGGPLRRRGRAARSRRRDPVLARSAEPLLEPELAGGRNGVVPNVVFPIAIDSRGEGGADANDSCGEGGADVNDGMADARIGAFRLTMAPLPRR